MNNKILNILVAEDFPINQKVISIMLTNLGHNFTLVENGQIAIDYFLKNKYDLILMDLQMPVLDGIECIKFIRNYEKEQYLNKTPIFALTAQIHNNEEEYCSEIGTDDFIAKPVKFDVLKSKLELLM